ncbi:MAG: helix-turn-helix transcriptional regulator [Clostridia bacterium]|nr:helix-turn-helix transcriptional regulator [Clostridia bacterium]
MAISAVILGKRLQKARLKKGYTQEYVAEKIDLSVPHLSRIERGRKTVYLDKLACWCDILDVPIEEILTGALLPENPSYNRQFGEIASGCSEETIASMLDICRQIADIEKKAKALPVQDKGGAAP